MTKDHICAHETCYCNVEEGERFCCSGCEQAASESQVPAAFDMSTCICGHPDCDKNRKKSKGS